MQHVTVVAGNQRTTEGLRQYLASAGLVSQSLLQLPEGEALNSLRDAVVLFPDDFNTAEVLTTITALLQRQPPLRLLLVTSSPQHFQSPSLSDAAQLLPKPAFGWSILDAIRAAKPLEGEPL